MPVINGIYLKDFPALPGAVQDDNIIPIAITGNQVSYRTTVSGIVTDARVTSKLLTGLSVTGGAVVATDTILEAFGKVQNQINGKQGTITLTTTGTSGAATLIGSTLNIPNYLQDLSGYVTLNTAQTITAAKTFSTSGNSDTLIINHSSGSGIALNITKGGNGEGIYVNKTSGSGNAVTIIGTLNATTLVKSGGTSSQFLKADGTVDSTAYGTGSVTSVAALTLGTTGTDLSSTVANSTTTPVITLNVPNASASNRGALSSTDWSTFNGKQAALSGTGVVKSTAGTISYLTETDLSTASTLMSRDGAGSTSIKKLTVDTDGGLGLTGTSQTTGQFEARFTNTGGGLKWGIENSIGGNFATGTTAYGSYFGTSTDTPLEFGTNGVKRVTILGSTGATTFTSTIAASNFSGSSTGTNTGDQTITLTGDVTGSGTGSFAATIANGAVTNAKLANSTISGVSLGSNLPALTFGTYLTGTSYNGTGAVSLATNASTIGAASSLVATDASSNITGSAYIANGSSVFTATNQATGAAYATFGNTGGTLLYGVYNSAGTGFGPTNISGMTAYATGFGTTAATPVQLFTNGTVRQTISSAGATTFTGSLTASSIIKSGGTSAEYLMADGSVTSGAVTTMAAIGATPNANGASISGSTLTLQPASESFGGVVTTATQTFGGAKTFSSTLTASTSTGIGAYILTNDATATGLNVKQSGGGNVLVLENNAATILTVANSGVSTFNYSVSAASFIPSGATVPTNGMYLSAANTLDFATNSTNRLRITSAGYTWVNGAISGFSASGVQLQVNGQSRMGGTIILHNTSDATQSATFNCTAASTVTIADNVVIVGSLSKGSGSFRIEHPLPSLSETHQLVHSFIEAPKADLIYRGKLTLLNGKGQANIDEVATMTEGTFEALCREVQCFTTNESGWDLVKGKVIGNIIYIESQNENSTDEISWMVIGERKDKHMMETGWTDENGKVIVEPLKPIEQEPMEDLTEVVEPIEEVVVEQAEPTEPDSETDTETQPNN
jgi:hypothetical protein